MQLTPIVLTGSRLRLDPLTLAHEQALAEIGLDSLLWLRTASRVATREDMRAYVQRALDDMALGTALAFAIVERDGGRVVGTTRYDSVVPEHRRLEIGFTWIGTAFQRRGYATESKFLLLGHAFETMACQRVEFKCDADNGPARAALRRLGAREEGILRDYLQSPQGARDVVIFSVIAREWPGMKQRLLAAIRAAERARR